MTEVKNLTSEVEGCAHKECSTQLTDDSMVQTIDYSIIFTGVTGSGKSQAINFLMKADVFLSKWSLKPVTTTAVSCTKIVGGKRLKVFETPGFLDPCALSHASEFKRLAKTIIDIPNGINAVALVISINHRITKEDTNLFEKLISMEEMLPYTFLILTHAKALGNTDKEQKEAIEKIIYSKENCPDILRTVLKNINNRFMLLESIESMEPEYHYNKSQELIQILQEIADKNTNLFSCALNDVTKQLHNVVGKSKEELIDALTEDLQTVKLELSQKQMKIENDIFWQRLFYCVAGASAATAAGVFFSSTIGANEMFMFLSNKSQIVIDAAKAASKYFH